MEEEDFPYPSPFFLQSANISNPKHQKQPKPSFSKCNCNPSSSITTKIPTRQHNKYPRLPKKAASDFTKFIFLPNAKIIQFYS